MVLFAAFAFFSLVGFRLAVGLLESAVHRANPVCNPERESDDEPQAPSAEVSVGLYADVAWQHHSQHNLQAESSVGSESFPVILHLNRLGGGQLPRRRVAGQR